MESNSDSDDGAEMDARQTDQAGSSNLSLKSDGSKKEPLLFRNDERYIQNCVNVTCCTVFWIHLMFHYTLEP